MRDWPTFFKNTNRNIFNQCLRSKYLIDLIIDNTPPEGNILEAGCGTALLSIILADYGFHVTAVDLDQDVLDYAQRNLIFNGKLRFVQGDLLKLSEIFRQEEFDTIISQGVMEHFMDDEIVTIMQEKRKVGNTIIFSVPNILRKLRKHTWYGDERLLTNRTWRRLMGEAGFKQIEIFGGDPSKLTYFLPRFLFERRFSFWRKYASSQTIVLCRQ